MSVSKQSVSQYKQCALTPAQMTGPVILVFLGVNVMGCNMLPAYQQKTWITERAADSGVKEQIEIKYRDLLTEKQAQQQEIERLQKLLAEKEAYIRNQELRQLDQAKTLQETSNRVAHAQVKLRRLATRPAAASTIAEVEMVMENLKSSPLAGPELILQAQAQRLLDAASISYGEESYGTAMDYAMQAKELINMVRNSRVRKASAPHQLTVSFQVPIPVRAIVNSNLREKPGLDAPVLGSIKKDAVMTAESYRGEWLQILTSDGRAGWVFNTLVEAQIGKPMEVSRK
jgi:hypothetical protein